MATYKTKAIILSSYPYREHDRIITLYSREFGKMDARARGTRKITSKLAGHLEPLIEAEILLANGRRWDILAGSRTLESYSAIRSDFHKMSVACVCAEAVKHISKPLSGDGRVFELLKYFFHQIERSESKEEHRSIAPTFLWNLLSLSGFRAELDRCINCKQKLESGSFSFEGGGMLCFNCQNLDILSIGADKETLNQLKGRRLQTETSRSIAKRFWGRIVDHHPLNSLNFFDAIQYE